MTRDETLTEILRMLLEDSGSPPTSPDTYEQPLSPTSTPTSPTLSTKPTPTSDVTMSLMGQMMTTLKEIVTFNAEQTRALVMDILQGREMPQTGQMVIEKIVPESSTSYDDTSSPLSPGIQAILDREEQETNEVTLQQVLLRERQQLQERLMSVQEEIRTESLSDDSWSSPFEPQETPDDFAPPVVT
jgi:hypothetical protein